MSYLEVLSRRHLPKGRGLKRKRPHRVPEKSQKSYAEKVKEFWDDDRVENLNGQLSDLFDLENDEGPILHFEWRVKNKEEAVKIETIFERAKAKANEKLKALDIVATGSEGTYAYVDMTVDVEASDENILKEAQELEKIMTKALTTKINRNVETRQRR